MVNRKPSRAITAELRQTASGSNKTWGSVSDSNLDLQTLVQAADIFVTAHVREVLPRDMVQLQ